MNTLPFLLPIEKQIVKVEEKMRSQLNGHVLELDTAIDHLINSGGKRIRPAIALLTGGMLGGDESKLISLSAAIELLHTATLVHDDLIDGALLRRGIATINSKWSPAATVLTGDYIFAQAARLASETNSIILMRRFSETLATIVNGELNQLFNTSIIIDRQDYYQRIYAKTASLFELAAEAAAYLSPVDDHTINLIKKFGYDIGMAFQIVDDVLDFTGEELLVGKPVANDLRQGVITLPALLFFEGNKRMVMNNCLSRVKENTKELDELIFDIRNSGAIDLAIAEASKFIDSAMDALSDQPNCIERSSLLQLADYITNRTH